MQGRAGGSQGKWGRYINANVTDAAFTVNQRGSGDLLDLQAAGSSVFTVSVAGALTMSGGLSLTAAGVALDVQNTTDASSNQVAIFKGGNRGTPADNDEGYLSFFLDDSTGTQAEFARMTWIATDVTSTTKDSKISFAVSSNRNAGALTTAFEITSTDAAVVSTTVTAPMVYAEATAPAGTLCYVVRDNTGDLTLNALTGKTVNVAVAGVDTIRVGATTVVFGTGEAAVGAKAGLTLRAPDHPGGTDTNEAGADITIAAGLGTGTGDAGTIIFQLPEVVGAGTTVQTRATVLTMDMVASTTDMSFLFTPNTTISSSGTLTIGAATLSGAIAGGDQAFTGVGDMTFTNGSILAAVDGAGTTLLLKAGGLSGTTFITLTSQSAGTDTMILGKTFFFDAGGESIESDGTYLTITSATTRFSGRIATGGIAPIGYIRHYIAGAFTSDGSSTNTFGIAVAGVLTGFSGDTDTLAGTILANSIATQSVAEVIGIITQLKVDEPQITLNGGATATVAATLYITSAPTEGVANYAIAAPSGDMLLGGTLYFFDKGGESISSDGATLTIAGNVAFPGAIYMNDTTSILTKASAGDYFAIKAINQISWGYDEVARAQGATDPYFSIGGSQQFKFYNSGITNFAHNVMFSVSVDSAAVADQVSIGGYEISAGHRALAISSEEAVVVEVDETKFSHKIPVRINGATYNLMLCAT
uniref:Uncharacterized protein n=2 Tax=viral metagenome TaxID=1070528 RepID=A0A6M3KD41_9ZZZZ